MTNWYIDPSFDPMQELKDLKEAHEQLADCHNQLVALVQDLSNQHNEVIKLLRYNKDRLERPDKTKQQITPV